MTQIKSLTAADLLRLYRKRELSPVEVTRDQLDRIETFQPAINAFIIVERDGALKAAQASEARWQKGEPMGSADGLGATVKDNVWLKDFPSRRGSLTVDAAAMKADAPAVARLREAGAVILGKTCLPEFGWIGATHSPLTGITRNPWKLDRTPGGSSGGAAAAALLNLGHLHIGTDGAGSIRIPAAFTGVFGIKPSYGRVAAYPASPFSILAHVGPLTRSVADAALMLSVIGGPDERDMTAWNTPTPDYRVGLDDGVRGLRVAWSPRLGYVQKLNPEVEAATAKAAQAFGDLGAIVEEADPGFAEPYEMIMTLWGAVSAMIVAASPESDRAKMDPGFLKLAEDGKKYSLADYLAAYVARQDLAIAMARFHETYDLLLTPQMPIPALEAGRVTPADGSYGDNWINWSPYTYPFNLTQQPAASVPCGFLSDGLPIGLQIVGPARQDHLVLRAARAFESARPFQFLDAPRQS
ncbi:MAG: aspartyl-tRNA(Asn)/glutamyl-tRNA(Gln) amidotransferase subunit [Hyphomicrobiales bacterium]|jgi:aspartyl-tRNA(Asn)/glutamyl-tRNA(Gln) amidotransferase subunit A|nr:aspartyl-tRNA(Asn)/glutamyl-tRNA(Gln) amidotransferase subunit [Hyphomicrobiales bacterium]